MEQSDWVTQRHERREGPNLLQADERKRYALYELAPVGHFTLDQNCLIREVNIRGCNLLETERMHLMMSRFSDFVEPRFRAAFSFCFEALLQHGGQETCEIELVRKTGSLFYARLDGVADHDEAGQVVRVYMAVIDITPQKRMETRLLEREQKLNERVKELDCLYKISKSIEQQGVSLNQILQEIADAIPYGWRFSEICCARITFNGHWIQTANFMDPAQCLIIPIVVNNRKIGNLEIGYLAIPAGDIGELFMEEELSLARDIGLRIGKVIERVETRASLEKSEKEKRAILDASVDRILYLDLDLGVVWANETVRSLPAISGRDILGRHCYALLWNADAPCAACPAPRSRETKTLARAEICHARADGTEGGEFWDVYSVPILKDKDQISGYIIISKDITNERKAMEALVQSEKRSRSLSQELISAQENERKMISCELHDRVAQELSLLKISCETLFDGCPEIPDAVRGKVNKMSGILEKTIMTVRDMSYELSPPGLHEMGLVRTAFLLCQDFSEKSDIRIDFFSAGIERIKLNSDSQINLYRLIQEGLNNIKKHARAGYATVKLVAASPHIMLRIEDDGIGFNVKERELRTTAEKRMGLRSMKERVNLLGGEMHIQSMPGKGAKIFIKIPIGEKHGDFKEIHIDR